ncbi:hypothetical protein BH11BAC5_BH11BAC5_23530 [soil metagenome]
MPNPLLERLLTHNVQAGKVEEHFSVTDFYYQIIKKFIAAFPVCFQKQNALT